MNKNLFRLAGTILTVEALFIIVVYFPLILKTFSPESTVIIVTLLIVLGVLAMMTAGIGALLVRKWAITILWISLALSFVASVVVIHQYPEYVYGGTLDWFFDLIIALFLTSECRKSNNM